MIPRYTAEEYTTAKANAFLLCECEICHHTFQKKKVIVTAILSGNKHYQNQGKYCSKSCASKSKDHTIKSQCDYCGKDIAQIPSQFNRSINHFCSKDCSDKFQISSITVNCAYCGKEITKDPSRKRLVKKNLFCSMKCVHAHNITRKLINCAECGKPVYKTVSKILHHPQLFCSRTCSGKYNTAHKTYGYRRSKIEVWLEDQLGILYPDLEIIYNSSVTIGLELDIYIPSLKLAFEINGIFHYEPIYGEKTLNQIQERDNNKFQHCIEKNISLCILDADRAICSPKNCATYLNIITDIIETKRGYRTTDNPIEHKHLS
jgi:endogenous inhibitor of DNA gyrase (YacG/DUF329 family)